MADATGTRLTLSLKNHAVTGSGQITDLLKVESLDGIFLANVRDQQIVSLYREMKHANKLSGRKPNNSADVNLADYKKTVITFNNGGSWRELTPPAIDADKKPVVCSGCALHLFLDSTHLLQGALTSKSALGIIVAHGNVGNSLSLANVGLYISNDGGSNWIHARNGQHRVAFGNHGGIILVGDAIKPTKTLYYSYNHGKTFEPVHFSSEGQEVTITSLKSDFGDAGSIKFFLAGLKHSASGTKGIAMIIDFAKNNLPECRLLSNPGSKTSDYEYFEFKPHNPTECLLGKKTTYVRRRPTARCHVNQSDGFKVL